LTLAITLLKIEKSIWDSNSHNESSFGSVRVHSLTLFFTLGSTRCDSWASFLVRNLASPYLGCKPKARVTTTYLQVREILIRLTPKERDCVVHKAKWFKWEGNSFLHMWTKVVPCP
jgi:acyl-CoA synthetase (AMP-forming)/AMP-acid ligase II